MQNQKFEDIISKDTNLSALLKEKKLAIAGNFSNKDFQTEGFKEYIKKDYIEAFNYIFENNSKENGGRKSLVLGTLKYLATDDFKDSMMDKLKLILDQSYEKFLVFKNQFEEFKDDKYALENKVNGENLDAIFEGINMTIYNQFGTHPKIQETKDKMIDGCFEICDAVANADPKRETPKYMIYNAIYNNLINIKLNPNQDTKLGLHRTQLNEKRDKIDNKYYIYIAVGVILLIIKILLRMNR